MTRRVFACLALVGGALTIAAQAPAAFDLTLVDVDGTKQVLGRLPPSTPARPFV
jgi:hypothetical protein